MTGSGGKGGAVADAKFIRARLIFAYSGTPGDSGLRARRPERGDDRLIRHVLGRARKQAERMACRVREDPPATGIDVKQPATQTENLRLGPVEVSDLNV